MFSYAQALKYINSLIDYEKKEFFPYNKRSLNLQRMGHLLNLTGNPHQNLKVIHIAGTKGKGSTAAIIASILKAANFKVGLYTSPHLIDARERIRIGEELIKEKEFARFAFQIKSSIDSSNPSLSPTFFEVYTAIAFLYFFYKKVDVAVLEVGLGGRLDATNIIAHPLVSIITQISFDHIRELGNNLASIAREKSCIIKKGSKAITSPQEEGVLSVIEETCKKKGVHLYKVGKEIKFKEIKSNLKGESFQVKTERRFYPCLFIPLLGKHQLINASTAIGAIEVLREYGIFVPRKAVMEGMKKVRWPGRIQILFKDPLFLVDCAHNVASAQALANFLKEISQARKIILIMGVSKNKDVEGMGKVLLPLVDEIILTKVNSPRAMEPEEIKKRIKNSSSRKIVIKDEVTEAISYTLSSAECKDIICVTGSVYLAGEVLKFFL
ncbi:MAG: folylpolyglutamate synthase/dihydrofolate synthase family protein [Candidatus Aerophobetes bacterium]|nr:folylpolyglutamate synthase/dihydrofolate synthase family protein [Candidatus Aerophobetes bacterium]